MPVVTIAARPLPDLHKKSTLVRRVTEAVCEAYGMPPESVTVFVEEHSKEAPTAAPGRTRAGAGALRALFPEADTNERSAISALFFAGVLDRTQGGLYAALQHESGCHVCLCLVVVPLVPSGSATLPDT